MYIDAEKLKTEIERLEHENCMNGGEHFCMRRAICLGNLRNIIAPPYHEQQEVDLEKDAVSYCYDNGINISPRQAKGIARYFYERGLNARKEVDEK